MSEMNEWNIWYKSVIAKFRASEGSVGGDLEGTPWHRKKLNISPTGRTDVAPSYSR